MSNIKIEWSGTDRLIRLLASGGSQSITALGRALHEEAQVIYSKSQAQVPYDTGALHVSGQIHDPAYSGSEVVVEITYGGNAAPYAQVQHENRDYRHDPGRKSHYLQDPFEEAIPDLPPNIHDRIEAILRGLI